MVLAITYTQIHASDGGKQPDTVQCFLCGLKSGERPCAGIMSLLLLTEGHSNKSTYPVSA